MGTHGPDCDCPYCSGQYYKQSQTINEPTCMPDLVTGLNLRDYFAAKAINAIIAQHRACVSEMVSDAYEIADAMIRSETCDWHAMNDNEVTMYRSKCDADARWEHLPIWYKRCPMCGRPVKIIKWGSK